MGPKCIAYARIISLSCSMFTCLRTNWPFLSRRGFGVSIELVSDKTGADPLPLLMLAREVNAIDSYEAELQAGSALVHHCVELYSKLFIASSP